MLLASAAPRGDTGNGSWRAMSIFISIYAKVFQKDIDIYIYIYINWIFALWADRWNYCFIITSHNYATSSHITWTKATERIKISMRKKKDFEKISRNSSRQRERTFWAHAKMKWYKAWGSLERWWEGQQRWTVKI